jgi:hypothetical protein
LGFQLTLEPDHPYLSGRGVAPELVELFGLGFCAKGSMSGRVCIPIENAEGELVAYAGRWIGQDADLPAGEEKYKLPKGFIRGSSSSTCTGSSALGIWSWSRATSRSSACTASRCPRSPSWARR